MKEAFEKFKQNAQEKAARIEEKIKESVEELAGLVEEGVSYSKGVCLANLGVLNSKLGKHEMAKDYFVKAIEVLEALPRDERVLAKLVEVTKLAPAPFLALKDDKAGRLYSNKSCHYWLELKGEDELTEEHVTVYGTLGDNYLDDGELNEALEYYKKRLAAREAVYEGDFGRSCIAEDYTVIGLVYRRMGDYKTAIKWQKESYERHLAIHNESELYSGKAPDFDWALYDACGHLIDTYEQAGKKLRAHYYRCKYKAMEKHKPEQEEVEWQ